MLASTSANAAKTREQNHGEALRGERACDDGVHGFRRVQNSFAVEFAQGIANGASERTRRTSVCESRSPAEMAQVLSWSSGSCKGDI